MIKDNVQNLKTCLVFESCRLNQKNSSTNFCSETLIKTEPLLTYTLSIYSKSVTNIKKVHQQNSFSIRFYGSILNVDRNLCTNTVLDVSVCLRVCPSAIETYRNLLSNFNTKHIFGFLMALRKF